MNKWRVAGLAVLTGLAVLLILRSCSREPTPAPTAESPVREKFHAAKPLRIVVKDDAEWLSRELRNLLLRGRMRLAIDEPQAAIFTLQIELAPESKALPAAAATPDQILTRRAANVALLAPDGAIERSTSLDLPTESRLASIQELARKLPMFLEAAQGGADWTTFLGTQDAAAYENFLLSADEIFSATSAGFTQPPALLPPLTVDRLEALTRKQSKFARAWGLLALGYLSLGGEDEDSLTQIAAAAAQRALALDPALANAQSALGLASLRQGQWIAAKEHFDAALELDADSVPSLEGTAALLMNVGQARAALPMARRAVDLQKTNVGANVNLAYAQFATGQNVDADASNAIAEVARVKALVAILSNDMEGARRVLLRAGSPPAAWAEPLLSAAEKQRKTADALRAITLAANDRSIDPATEILAGAALRQSEFVFNRMLRLHKQHQAVPLRILWLPQTDFLRRHARFEQIVTAAALLPFWQEHGAPDVCTSEPQRYGCKQQSGTRAKKQN